MAEETNEELEEDSILELDENEKYAFSNYQDGRDLYYNLDLDTIDKMPGERVFIYDKERGETVSVIIPYTQWKHLESSVDELHRKGKRMKGEDSCSV